MKYLKNVKTLGDVKLTHLNQTIQFSTSKIVLQELDENRGQLIITDENENTVISVIFTK